MPKVVSWAEHDFTLTMRPLFFKIYLFFRGHAVNSFFYIYTEDATDDTTNSMCGHYEIYVVWHHRAVLVVRTHDYYQQARIDAHSPARFAASATFV